MRTAAFLCGLRYVVFLLPLTGAADGLLQDEFAEDGLGSVLGWEFRWGTGATTAERLREAGPAGRPAVRIAGSEPKSFAFAHPALTLVGDEPYRLSAWVRTRGLSPTVRSEFLVYNAGWKSDVGVRLPADTAGEWKRIVWQGKMLGSIRTNDYSCVFYFSSFPEGASVDISEPTLEPQSERARQGSAVQPGPSQKYVARIIPIDPLIAKVDARTGRLTFYYPGDLAGDCRDYDLVGSIAGRELARAALGEDRRATLVLGKLAEGRQTLDVRLVERATGTTIACNAYSIRAIVPLAPKTVGRRLNNFVTEIVNVPLADGEVPFENPRTGWVYVGTDRTDASVSVDGCAAAAETMRRLETGRHVVTVSGAGRASGGRLFVRLVKPLFHGGTRLTRERSDPAAHGYGWDFCSRFTLGSFNSLTRRTLWRRDEEGEAISDKLRQRGVALSADVGLMAADKRRASVDTIVGHITNTPSFKAGFRVLEVDENALGASRLFRHNYAEACWRLFDPDLTMHLFYNDAVNNAFTDPKTHTGELSAVLNGGEGEALILPEVYLRGIENEADALAQEEQFVRLARSARALMPEAPSHIVYYLGGWIAQGGWTPWYCPDADLKPLYDHFLWRLATDPEFADLGGAGFSTPACDENIYRWTARLLRHYCIEGRTDRLSDAQGFAYLPGHLANGDFERGLDGWTVRAAESGGIEHGTIKGFGRKGMNRLYRADDVSPKHPYGDSFALFTRSGRAPNRLSRAVTGLVPGRAYELTFCTVDYRDALAEAEAPASFAFRSRIVGAEEIREITYEYVSHAPGVRRWDGRRLPVVVTHRRVFRATSDRAEIELSDWRDDRDPGGPVGERRLVNFVGVRPYYEGEKGDMADLKRIFLNGR